MDYRQHIVLNPEVRFGKPIVRGTRIAVGDILSYLAGGMSEDEILSDFPQLSREDIRACLAFAADRERALAGSGPAAQSGRATRFHVAVVKLLIDENLAGRLARDLADVYPGSADVISLGLGGAADREIQDRAAADGFVLVTKDEDFHRLSVFLGPPPKVIWVRLGNCGTADVERLLRARADDVHAFVNLPEAPFLGLG